MTVPKPQIFSTYRRVRESITSPMSVRSAWLAIAPVLGELNDGHVALGFPEELNKAPRRFPLRFMVSTVGDSLLVKSDRTGTIPQGSRIVSVEDVPAADYLRTTLAAFGGQTRALARWRVTAAGAWTAIAVFGSKEAYRVRWVDPSGAAHEATILAASNTAPHPPSEPYSFSWLRNGVGLIDYRQCEDIERFKKFLDETFTTLQTASAAALIIDIRHNAGGDSNLNDLLWAYAQAKPFKQFGGIIERSSDRLKRAYGREKYVRLYGEQAWAAADGVILRQESRPDEGLITPGPLPIRFRGSVYLLISTETFSSGMSCALAAKDYGLATIVGEETGEPVIGTGELYAAVTPNLHLQAYLTTKVFLAPKYHPNAQGVVPDIPVAASDTNLSVGKDAVLERTLAMIDVDKKL
jgi:hypothetical protein